MNKTVPRSASICAELIASIASGALRPGDPIDMAVLCRRHRVSRTVVREAIAELAGKGLIVARPGIGTEVAAESRWNLLDAALIQASLPFDGPGSLTAQAGALRRVIEPAIAADAARHASRTARASILQSLRRIASATGSGKSDSLPMLANALHETIASASPNRMLGMIDRAVSPARVAHYQRLQSTERLDCAPVIATRPLIARQTGLALAVVRGEVLAASSHALDLASLCAGLNTGAQARSAAQGDYTSQHAVDDHDDPDGPATRPMPDTDTIRLRIPSLLALSARSVDLPR